MVAKTITDAEGKGIVGRRLGAIIRKPIESDVELVVDYLMGREKKPFRDRDSAREHAVSAYKANIRTCGRSPQVTSFRVLVYF